MCNCERSNIEHTDCIQWVYLRNESFEIRWLVRDSGARISRVQRNWKHLQINRRILLKKALDIDCVQYFFGHWTYSRPVCTSRMYISRDNTQVHQTTVIFHAMALKKNTHTESLTSTCAQCREKMRKKIEFIFLECIENPANTIPWTELNTIYSTYLPVRILLFIWIVSIPLTILPNANHESLRAIEWVSEWASERASGRVGKCAHLRISIESLDNLKLKYELALLA